MTLAQALFSPRSVALVGASGDEAKNTARPQRYLSKFGYPGRIFPVNPGRSGIFGIPCFKTVAEIKEPVDHAFIMVGNVDGALEACADAFHAYFSWREPRPTPEEPAVHWPEDLPSRGKLNEHEALKFFAALGVPVVESALARAPDYAHPLAYPVALKILSAEVAHKSDAGGVVLGVKDSRGLQENALKIGKAAGKPVAEVLIQRMEQGLAEAIVGYRDDPVVGPLVMVGAGGILAQLYNDVVLRLAPVDEAGALEMIAQVRGFAVLRGYRGLPPGDLPALARAVAAMSRLALLASRPVREAEANPVVVKSRGAVAVDALAVLKQEMRDEKREE